MGDGFDDGTKFVIAKAMFLSDVDNGAVDLDEWKDVIAYYWPAAEAVDKHITPIVDAIITRSKAWVWHEGYHASSNDEEYGEETPCPYGEPDLHIDPPTTKDTP